MMTKGMITEIYQRQSRHERAAQFAARQAARHIQPALDAAQCADVGEARHHAQAAADLAQRARASLLAARDEAYQTALMVGASQPEAHAAAISATTSARHYAESAAESWRTTRRALTYAHQRMIAIFARYN